ncbi:AraC family transcriptional regulator [Marinobacterium aestuariivivens]|uniref:AraC family transcriptional regulator n=1 Tax=Marinobacterium aestuariivivens TaxID=1698799 RepID=A0ABW1ZWS0_9GAMM
MLGTRHVIGSSDDREIMTDILDAEGARSWMESICGPHDLRVRNPKTLRFRHVGSVLSSTTTTIGHIEYGTDVSVEIDDLQNSYSISLPQSGFQELQTADAQAQSDLASGVIISPSRPCILHMSGNCRKTLVRISRQAMESGLEKLIRRPVSDPLVFAPQMEAALGPVSAWWRTVRHIEEELRNPHSLYLNGHFVREMEQALIKGILLSQPNNYSSVIELAVSQTLPGYLARTADFIHRNAQESISIEDIENTAGVSRNKLYNDFKKYFGEPPTAYLKRIRLERVREDILQDHGYENISGIAMKWGFNHLGRFSADYKKQFNESPSETLQRTKPKV